MKCDKCGFVSFDYLSECRRCGADLSATREHLGFSALKSEVPFLLGALLKGGGMRDTPNARVGEEPGGSANESVSSLGSEHPFHPEVPPPSLPAPPEAEMKADRPATEELIIELSEADLESLSGGKESNKVRVSGKKL
jgi:hypothetical protein